MTKPMYFFAVDHPNTHGWVLCFWTNLWFASLFIATLFYYSNLYIRNDRLTIQIQSCCGMHCIFERLCSYVIFLVKIHVFFTHFGRTNKLDSSTNDVQKSCPVTKKIYSLIMCHQAIILLDGAKKLRINHGIGLDWMGHVGILLLIWLLSNKSRQRATTSTMTLWARFHPRLSSFRLGGGNLSWLDWTATTSCLAYLEIGHHQHRPLLLAPPAFVCCLQNWILRESCSLF